MSIYDYGLADYAQLSVWYIILAGLIQWQGWLTGIILYAVTYNVIGLMLKATMNLEMMGGMDEIFFGDDNRNSSNIVAFQKFKKFDPKRFAKTIVTRACIFPRLKSKVTKFLGKYMFEEMTDKEMIDSISKTCPIVSGIHNEKDLADFMAKE